MSLNGLDDAKIKEAHDTAVAEPGGWFLLKYASRDEVELLGRGNAGIVEIRNAIASYEEESPLFGFLRYRRRNVVIKYVPEECSRLVQARATVHFNAVLDRFAPHDTVFPIASSKDLKDSTLSAACSLHTASGSVSSSTSSLRRRRLMEIAEDAEEDDRAKRQSTVPEERPSTASASATGPPPPLPEASSYQSMVSEAENSAKDHHRPSSPSKTLDEPRKSSQSTRPELLGYSSYNSKPKIKLGPRPSLDVGGSNSTSKFRPVSSLPAGLKLFSRTSKSTKDRPTSQYPLGPPSMTVSPPAALETTMSSPLSPPLQAPRPHTSGGRPPSSTGTPLKPLLPVHVNVPKMPTMTPEKARLMKALELRKKQMSAKAPVEPLVAKAVEDRSDSLVAGTPARPLEMNKEVPDKKMEEVNKEEKEDDSGISFDGSSVLRTDESDATRESYPVSPVGPSEQAESTRASSISGSTDETVQDSYDPRSDNETTKGSHITAQAAGNQSSISTLQEPISDEADVTPIPSLVQVAGSYGNKIEVDRALDATEKSHGSTGNPTEDSEVSGISAIVAPAGEVVTEAQEELKESGESTVILQDVSQIVELQVDQPTPQSLNPSIPHKSESELPEELCVEVEQAAPLREEVSAKSVQPATDSLGFERKISSDAETPVDGEEASGNTPDLLKKKPRKAVEPIRTDLDTDRSAVDSDDGISSDDDLMDELQSAVFQEAQPITVSKSPISPVFPSPVKLPKDGNRFSRAFSGPLLQSEKEKSYSQLLSPPAKEPSRSVSASAAYLNRISQQPSQPLIKKVSLGSGISQRIKALEKLQGAGGAAATTAPTASSVPGSSPSFFAVRKANARVGSPSIADRANSLNRNTPSPSASRESSPEAFKIRDRSGSLQKRLGTFGNGLTTPSSSRPESISVTARIIRDPSQPFPKKSELGKDPSEYAPLDLKQSPLVIDHQPAAVTPPKETLRERRLSTSSKASKSTNTRRSSVAVIKDLVSQGRNSFSEHRRSMTIEPSASSPAILSPTQPPSAHGNSVPSARRLSISSRRSNSSRDLSTAAFSPPQSARSSSSTGDEKEKKSGRAGRMFRKMSSSISSSSKNILHAISPSVREENEPLASPPLPSAHAMASPLPTSVQIGDVNVQFPDTLLWKRRTVTLDSQGYLIVSPALTAHGSDKDKANAGAVRRYHLSTFRAPVIPDMEVQELPDSVVLDFVEGGGLQLACEDRSAQNYVLNVLQDAHQKWAAYGR